MTEDELRSRLFARRRYHEAGNRPGDTVEQWQKRERILTLLVWGGAIIFTPILIALHVYVLPHKPLPWWFEFAWLPVMIIVINSWMFLFLLRFLSPRPCYGRWIFAFDGIFYRYGKVLIALYRLLLFAMSVSKNQKPCLL